MWPLLVLGAVVVIARLLLSENVRLALGLLAVAAVYALTRLAMPKRRRYRRDHLDPL